MKLSIEFPELATLLSRMGAGLSSWQPGAPGLSDLELLREELSEGKEIPLGDVENSGGLLSYKGEQVVLYIKDTRQDRDTLLHHKKDARRFHFAECRTLDRMRREGRFERFVVTTRQDGLFLVESIDHYTRRTEELEAALGPCINCLRHLNWKNYEIASQLQRHLLWDEFSLDDFFAEYSTLFQSRPTHTDRSAPRGEYARDWSKISERFRQSCNWRCEECDVDLNEHKSLLHCHPISGVISDNRRQNIKVFCVVCPSEQPAHARLKPRPQDRRLIERLRIENRMR